MPGYGTLMTLVVKVFYLGLKWGCPIGIISDPTELLNDSWQGQIHASDETTLSPVYLVIVI